MLRFPNLAEGGIWSDNATASAWDGQGASIAV